MRILSLDLATNTGWAMNENGWKVSGVQMFDVKRGESPGMRFLRCRSWLNELLTLKGKIDAIVYEQAHHRGGSATAVGVGLVTTVQAFAAEHNIELMAVHTGTLKKFATGKGNASKEEMIAAAQSKGWDPKDDNEADAQMLLEHALDTIA